MQKAISSLQISVNGAAIAQTRQRDYMRSLQKVWFSKAVFQKRFNQCGGTPQMYDSQSVGGELLNVGNGDEYAGGQAITQKLCGFTGDSGIRDQLKNVLACQIAMPFDAADPDENDMRDIRVSWKINGTGLFSPLGRYDKIAASCPYRQSARALPHMNTVNIQILFVDLFRCLIRNLSTVKGHNGALGVATLEGTGNNALSVGFPPNGANAKLYVEFLRLPSWRQQTGTALLQTFRVAIHDPNSDIPTGCVTIPSDNLDGTNQVIQCLLPTGIDRGFNGPAAQWRVEASKRECEWNGITSAQLPQFLFVVLEKTPELFVASDLGGVGGGVGGTGKKWVSARTPQTSVQDFPNAAGDRRGYATNRNQYLARNTDSNAAITRFALEIMSVQGSYVYSAETWPYLKSRTDLHRDVCKYAIDEFDDLDTFYKHNCIVYLGCEEFAKGISSSGTAFPCTIKVKAQFENFRNYIDGFGCVGQNSVGMGACQDVIGGRPVLGFIFPQQSVQISASSALLSAMNISHSSAMEILARG
jgi:hypothetical protein